MVLLFKQINHRSAFEFIKLYLIIASDYAPGEWLRRQSLGFNEDGQGTLYGALPSIAG